jgi:hypothetical protein
MQTVFTRDRASRTPGNTEASLSPDVLTGADAILAFHRLDENPIALPNAAGAIMTIVELRSQD